MARASSALLNLMRRTLTDLDFRSQCNEVRLICGHLLALGLVAQPQGRLGFFGSVLSLVSREFSIPETQAETQLETLEKLGWIERDEDTDSLWMSGTRAGAARTEAAKANGCRGGRPRKGETLEQMRERKAELARRQGHLIMGISGGAAETQETQEKPNGESSRAVPTTTSSIEVSGGSTAREETDLVSLTRELATIARLPANRQLDLEPVAAWLAAGASTGTIRSVVAKLASRGSYDPAKVMTWRFFNAGIKEAKAERSAPLPAACRPELGVVDEDGAKAGLNLNGQSWVKAWKQARSQGQDTAVKEATMKGSDAKAWELIQSLKKRPEYQNPENFRTG
jgi:hypothetical protein